MCRLWEFGTIFSKEKMVENPVRQDLLGIESKSRGNSVFQPKWVEEDLTGFWVVKSWGKNESINWKELEKIVAKCSDYLAMRKVIFRRL
jgi:hypothetical protein